MDISVVGATGNVGRHVALGLVQLGLVGVNDRLQLVGHRGSPNASQVFGMREDILDAFAERSPLIDSTDSIDDIIGDIVVMAAGKSGENRNELAASNLAVLQRLGDHLRNQGSGHEVVVVLTNPVELATLVLARAINDPLRVIGMGSFLDSHRFRKEIAKTCKCYPSDVTAYMLGEHGEYCVPIWSSVRIRGKDMHYVCSRLAPYIRSAREFMKDMALVTPDLKAMCDQGSFQKALEHLHVQKPDVRAALMPFLCLRSEAMTSVGTADKVCRLLRCVLQQQSELVPVQTCLSMDLQSGLDTCIGVPAIIGMEGIQHIPPVLAFSPEENASMREAADAVARKVSGWVIA